MFAIGNVRLRSSQRQAAGCSLTCVYCHVMLPGYRVTRCFLLSVANACAVHLLSAWVHVPFAWTPTSANDHYKAQTML
jgi:hypothetical protein